MAYKYSVGQPFVYPQNDLTTPRTSCACASRCRARTTRSTRCWPRRMDRIFILHADHEQNASTSTVRLAGSSGANPFACIAAGIACLWGPAHGGANEAALNMLTRDRHASTRSREFISAGEGQERRFRLMGFGHRVYKNYDPRAKVMQQTCHEVLERARPCTTTRCSRWRWSWRRSR